MHILLTSDDGIHAPSLQALAESFIAAGHRVSISAPDRERSAASHSTTIGRALKATPVDYPGAENTWAVDGTPSDCASLGLWLTREDPVDLVAAGINYGMNQGGAVVCSGTVGAAMCGVQARRPGAGGVAVRIPRRPCRLHRRRQAGVACGRMDARPSAATGVHLQSKCAAPAL